MDLTSLITVPAGVWVKGAVGLATVLATVFIWRLLRPVEPHKPRYIFICDPGIPGCGDPDDLKCLILAARAHRTGRAVLEGVIALNDAEGGWGRAALARALLKHLGCDEVPVAVGDTGEFPAPDAEHVSGYLPAVAISELHDGHNLLRRLVNDSAPRSITLVAIAPMMDLAILVRRRPDLCLHAFREVCVQGGIVRDASGAWQPDRSGNMASDEAHDAAHVVYSFCLENSVRLTVYQRDAVPLLPMSLAKGLALDHPDDPIMRLLVDSQEVGLVERVWAVGVCGAKPWRPDGRRWFFTTFGGVSEAAYDADPEPYERLGAADDVRPYLNGCIKPYDVCALLMGMPWVAERLSATVVPHVEAGLHRFYQNTEHADAMKAEVEAELRAALEWAVQQCAASAGG